VITYYTWEKQHPLQRSHNPEFTTLEVAFS